MRIDLYDNELKLTPNEDGESVEINDWFNALGHTVKGSGNFHQTLAFDAKVYVTKRQTGSGLQLSIAIDVTEPTT